MENKRNIFNKKFKHILSIECSHSMVHYLETFNWAFLHEGPVDIIDQASGLRLLRNVSLLAAGLE